MQVEKTCLFVGNLSTNTAPEQLFSVFKKHGKINNKISVKRVGCFRAYTFIDFSDADCAKSALKEHRICLNGRRIIVDYARQSQTQCSVAKNKVPIFVSEGKLTVNYAQVIVKKYLSCCCPSISPVIYLKSARFFESVPSGKFTVCVFKENLRTGTVRFRAVDSKGFSLGFYDVPLPDVARYINYHL